MTPPTISIGMPLSTLVPVANAVARNGAISPIRLSTRILASTKSASAPHSAAGASLVIWLVEASTPGQSGSSAAAASAYGHPTRNRRAAR